MVPRRRLLALVALQPHMSPRVLVGQSSAFAFAVEDLTIRVSETRAKCSASTLPLIVVLLWYNDAPMKYRRWPMAEAYGQYK